MNSLLTINFEVEEGRQARLRRLLLVLGISLILHILFLKLITVSQAMEQQIAPIEVMLIQKSKQQIVPPTEKEETPPKETTKVSERDSRTEQETIKRGMPTPPAPPTEVARQMQPTPKKIKPKQQAKESKQPILRLDPDTLATTLSKPESTEEQRQLKLDSERLPSNNQIKQAVRSLQQQDRYRPFRNAFRFNPGDPDYLPDIPDGSITQLNAKAEHYAVFVRRVGLQVFGLLRTKNWQQLPRGEVQRVRDVSLIKVVMSPDGKLMSASLLDSSGSRVFDRLSLGATEEGAWDNNPPKGARAADGNIHFVFAMQTWSRINPGAREGEERWIRMQIGLL